VSVYKYNDIKISVSSIILGTEDQVKCIACMVFHTLNRKSVYCGHYIHGFLNIERQKVWVHTDWIHACSFCSISIINRWCVWWGEV